MAGRRKVYGTSTIPRFKAKMYDYISKGGRIPMVLAMEVVDAMGDSWYGNFKRYKDLVDKAVEAAYTLNPDVPDMYAGLAKGLTKKILKITWSSGFPIDDAFRFVAEEKGLTEGDPVYKLLRDAVGYIKHEAKQRPITPTK